MPRRRWTEDEEEDEEDDTTVGSAAALEASLLGATFSVGAALMPMVDEEWWRRRMGCRHAALKDDFSILCSAMIYRMNEPVMRQKERNNLEGAHSHQSMEQSVLIEAEEQSRQKRLTPVTQWRA